jgi:hypothetical protein
VKTSTRRWSDFSGDGGGAASAEAMRSSSHGRDALGGSGSGRVVVWIGEWGSEAMAA